MNTERLLSAGMAVVVVAAIGLSASTLAASMSTDPADAVDVQWDALPLGEDDQGGVESAAETVDETFRQGGSGERDGQGDGGDAQRPDPQSGDGASEGREAGESAGDQASQGGDAGGERADSADRSGPEQTGLSDSTGWAGLVPGGLPLWYFLALVPLLAAVILAYRYRDRLRRAGEGDPGDSAAEPLSSAPQNDVERAWAELIERAGVDRPRTRTPRDCARRAVETGFDPAQVDRLRRAFEDVRYGTQPPTDEQARVARETLARLDGGAA
ncbi:DUF4129 domain-containing protein [Haloarcula laminariae]|uniref:DUF4129 domain-containing protein n=1 Tax=Haloarcula laminariae TaxID=2961577 RepID=UPI0021C98F78|nr:DUF4129 domain-containing protein [Halomicroarcula laminariae]